jgi:hypothetical protein
VYVLAPEGINVNESPGQIAPPNTVIVGSGFTARLNTADAEQLLALVPVTVYEAEEFGETIKTAPVEVPQL